MYVISLFFQLGLGYTPTQTSLHLIATSIIGVAAGICFNSVFNTALGNLKPEEAGSASGSLSAILAVTALCLLAIPLLPRTATALEG